MENKIIPNTKGIVNIGNTCYLNSALQLLSNTKFLAINIIETIENEDNILNDEKKSLSQVIFQEIYNKWRNENVNPKKILKALSKYDEEYKSLGQSDSHKVLLIMLDKMDDELRENKNFEFNFMGKKKYIYDLMCKIIELKKNKNNKDLVKFYKKKLDILLNDYPNMKNEILGSYYCKKIYSKNYSLIRDIFMGIYNNNIVCSECCGSKEKFENFLDINLSVNDNELEKIIKKNVNGCEIIESYKCEKCNNKVKAYRYSFIWKLPKVLIIQFNRYKNFKGNSFKINSNINIPQKLSLKEYSNRNMKNYSLYSVIIHKGRINFGHYYSYCKNPIDNEWYLYNDYQVLKTNYEKIKEDIGRYSYIIAYEIE